MVKAANGTPLLTTAYAFRDVNAQQTTAQIEFRNVRLGENGSVLEGKKYTYDALGNITEISQSAYPYNVLVKYEYDAQNQLVSEIYYDGSGSATANITVAYYYTYDTAGNLQKVEEGTVHAGVLIKAVHQTYTYSTGDWKDLLESVTTDGTTCNILYDGSGNPTTYGNWGFIWQNGRQLFEAQADTDTTHTALSYAYDAEGIRTSKTCTVETWEDIPQYTVTFVADGTTVKTMTVGDGYVLQNSDYPTVPPKTGYTGTWNRYTSAIHSNITIQAAYTVVATYTVTFVARGLTVKTMTVNDGYVLKSSDYPAVPPRRGYAGRWNRYTSPIHSNITITAIYTQDGGIEIPIDPVDPPVIMSLEDEDDAAASVGEQEAPAEVQETAELSGDRTGQRLVSTQTVQHDYLTLSGRVARETITTDGTVTAILDFIYDSQGRPFALNYSADGGNSFTTYYYVLNLQGDVVKLISYIPGFEYEEVANYTYDAWGNIISATGEKAELNPLRYRGYYYDSETGFYYLQSRYYDPANHRFINADVYASTDSSDAIACNMFAYCGNNPVNRSDAEGQFWHLIVGAVIGAVVAAVTTAVTGGDLGDVLIAAAGGAVSGALTASGAGTLAQVAGGAAISMATNAATQAKEIVSGEKKLSDFSIGSMLMDGVAGAACGFISGPGASNGLGGAFKNNQMVELGFNTVKRTANAFVRHGSKAYLKEAGKAAKYYIKSTIKVTKNLFKGRSFASQAANFVYNWVKD